MLFSFSSLQVYLLFIKKDINRETPSISFFLLKKTNYAAKKTRTSTRSPSLAPEASASANSAIAASHLLV